MAYSDYPFIDLRDELKTIFKDFYQWYGLRQPDYSKQCSCTLNTAEGGIRAPDKACSRCFSTGFVFTDYIVKGYNWLGNLGAEFPSGPGVISTQANNIVINHRRPLNKGDLILILDQSNDKLVTPIDVTKQFVIQGAIPMRLDKGRIEYWRGNMEERLITDYRPGEEGTNFKYLGNRSSNEPI